MLTWLHYILIIDDILWTFCSLLKYLTNNFNRIKSHSPRTFVRAEFSYENVTSGFTEILLHKNSKFNVCNFDIREYRDEAFSFLITRLTVRVLRLL